MAEAVYERIHRANTPFALRYLADVWRYRYLASNLISSDLRSRFRRSAIGPLWAIIQPMGYTFVVSYVLSVVIGQDFQSFWLYLISGWLIWDVIAGGATGGIHALTSGVGYLRQARIPLFIFQFRVAMGGFVTLFFAFIAMLVVMVITQQPPAWGPQLTLIAPLLVLLFLFVMPMTIIFSLLATSFRDLPYILPILVQLGFLSSPVMLPREAFQQRQLAALEFINPAVSFLDMFRDPVLYGRWWDRTDVLLVGGWISAVWIIALLMAASNGRQVVYRL